MTPVLSEFVLAHRMVIQPAARLRNLSADQIVMKWSRTWRFWEFTQKTG
jgi:hypothetical protein